MLWLVSGGFGGCGGFGGFGGFGVVVAVVVALVCFEEKPANQKNRVLQQRFVALASRVFEDDKTCSDDKDSL